MGKASSRSSKSSTSKANKNQKIDKKMMLTKNAKKNRKKRMKIEARKNNDNADDNKEEEKEEEMGVVMTANQQCDLIAELRANLNQSLLLQDQLLLTAYKLKSSGFLLYLIPCKP